ncbi:CoA transferase [Devosia sp. SD17-2]|uniref:CoA transferase n=1 Tax=Devosia sp. SD17-2 TaxID=2976459 RepID=UPI0023D7DE3C|nr:CoA transferase [Devosia sp. SD17-2]WEJ34782.1 CoA transferase [Devosia sp. SD17-2]
MTALSNLKVVDLSESVAGQYCSRLMAGYGADVVLVEPPGGSRVREIGPFSKQHGDSTTFYHLNIDKRSIELDADKDFDRLSTLCVAADVVLVPKGDIANTLRQKTDKTVFCRISDFGEHGPYANWQGGEMIHQALSGIMYYNGRAGEAPLFGVGQRVQHVAGVAAYTAILAALRAGTGELIDIDVHKTASSMSYNLANQYFYSGTFDERNGTKYNPDLLIRANDGWVTVFVYAYRWPAMCEALGLTELLDHPDFQTQVDRLARWDQISEMASAAARDMSSADLVMLLQNLGVPAAASLTPAELATSPHLQARNYWKTADQNGTRRRAFGAPFRLSQSDWRADRALAELQEDAK